MPVTMTLDIEANTETEVNDLCIFSHLFWVQFFWTSVLVFAWMSRVLEIFWLLRDELSWGSYTIKPTEYKKRAKYLFGVIFWDQRLSEKKKKNYCGGVLKDFCYPKLRWKDSIIWTTSETFLLMEEILHHLAKTVKTLQGGPLPVISV